jgi:hypothetical protein
MVLLFVWMVAGCGVHAQRRLYRLDDPYVVTFDYIRHGTGHTRLTGTAPDGEYFEGAASTVSGMSMSFATGSASAASGGSFAWANAMGFAFNQPGVQYGSSVAVGNKGTVIEALYAVDPWTMHGFGVGKDNKGNRYRVQFWFRRAPPHLRSLLTIKSVT